MSNSYEIDNVVQTEGTFRDQSSALIDPTNVQVIVTDPNGVATTYIYGTHIDVVRDSLGVYHIDLLRSIAGTWTDKWQGWDAFPGDRQASKSDCFEITEGCPT